LNWKIFRRHRVIGAVGRFNLSRNEQQIRHGESFPMNSTPSSIPGLVWLYWHDLTIQLTANVAAFGAMFVTVAYLVIPPGTMQPIDDSFEAAMVKPVLLGGIAMTGLALLILVSRWTRVRKILREGTVIKGFVEAFQVIITEKSDRDSYIAKPSIRRSYHHTVYLRYSMHGEERQVSFQMTNSGHYYGLVKGQETDLMLLDSMPNDPLICSIYLGQSCHPSRGLSVLSSGFFRKSNTKIPDQTLAARKLRMAKALLNKGHVDTAVRSLEEIVKKYPDTMAAAESQLLLSKHGNGS
jgi:hypothetical protein